MKFVIGLLSLIVILAACSNVDKNKQLAVEIKKNTAYETIIEKSHKLIKTGFNAGEGYNEVWIRDYNTFIELSAKNLDVNDLKENLYPFFRFQDLDGNIVDGFVPIEKAGVSYKYIYSDSEPRYAAHKNTVETDQESSLIQAVYKFVKSTKDTAFLNTTIDGISIANRLELAMEFLLNDKLNKEYGLIIGATTSDWGDVQPEHEWGVFITEKTHYSIDIYDNAMFVIALKNLASLLPDRAEKWENHAADFSANIRKHLWDKKNQKFIPHIYLDGSPFPEDFNESEIYYHGGTIVAIEAGILTPNEILDALNRMISNVKASNASSIGLTIYPAYPDGFFMNPGMSKPYTYQNGGDWTWFGARIFPQLVNHGFVKEAVEQLQPMVDRVIKHDGFYEWWTVDNQPKGSGFFRGSAGVLYSAVISLKNWSELVLEE